MSLKMSINIEHETNMRLDALYNVLFEFCTRIHDINDDVWCKTTS